MAKRAAKWHVDPPTEKIRLTREGTGSGIMLETRAPTADLVLASDTQQIICDSLQEAVNDLREGLKPRLPAPLFHEEKITFGRQGRRILLEIDAPRIRSEGTVQRKSVRRKTRKALDAIQEALDSPSVILGFD